MYDGSAGLAGMLVQVGAHAAMINSGRDSKLSEQQTLANNNIKLLDELTGKLILGDILSADVMQSIASVKDANTVFIKPIFFSDQRMRRLTLKLIAWLPKDTSKGVIFAIKIWFKSMITYQTIKIVNLTRPQLHERFQRLLEQGLKIVASDVSGQYQLDNIKTQTFKVKYDDRNTVVRGKLVEETCTHQVIKNLRKWYIVVPKVLPAPVANVDLNATC